VFGFGFVEIGIGIGIGLGLGRLRIRGAIYVWQGFKRISPRSRSCCCWRSM